jgi:hypothetical protein
MKWVTGVNLKTVLTIISIPVFAGVVLITTLSGQPKLPFLLGLSVAAALLAGLFIGFCVTNDLILNFRKTIVYLISGLGLVPFLIFFKALELPEKGLLSWPVVAGIVLFSLFGGFVWLFLTQRAFRKYKTSSVDVVKGTLFISYLVLPVIHYFLATPKGIPYITTSDNFFADNLLLRIINWILLILIIVAVKKPLEKYNKL